MCGIGCIVGGLFANLPFIIAPPTAISIFLSIFLQQNRLDTAVGNQAVVASGIGLIFLGYRPLGRFLSQVSLSLTHPHQDLF
jgi:xanthine/uracil/vitamin C permease (AzgA family)